MALQPDARHTIAHLLHATLHERKAQSIVLTEEQQRQLEAHRAQVLREAQARGERTQ